MATDTLFVILLITMLSLMWATLAIPSLRLRLPASYPFVRSWWLLLVALCSCYLIAKISDGNHYFDSRFPYQWLLVAFFVLIGLRGSYEIIYLWRSEDKSKLIEKLQARGLQTHTLALPLGQNPNSTPDSTSTINNTQPYVYLNLLDGLFSFAFMTLIVSLVFLQQLTWHREQYGILLFVLFASQLNDMVQYLFDKYLKGKLFKRGLAPRISPNKSIEGAIFGSLIAALIAGLFGMWLTPFSWWVCLLSGYGLAMSGIAGAILESAFKRQHGVKNTGTMTIKSLSTKSSSNKGATIASEFDGVGGVLDKIDSLLIGVPLFTLAYWLLG